MGLIVFRPILFDLNGLTTDNNVRSVIHSENRENCVRFRFTDENVIDLISFGVEFAFDWALALNVYSYVH